MKSAWVFCQAQVQVQVRWRSDDGQEGQESQIWTWAIPYFWFPPTHHPTTHHKLFSWLLRGLDKSDVPRMGWYDSCRLWGGQDLQVDSRAKIKWDYRGDIREYSNEDYEDERPSKIYPQKLTTQRQKSFESHLSSTLMQVKLVFP